MTRYSVQPGNKIFVKGYGFLSFAKNMVKNVSKNIITNLSGKYNQELLDDAKQSATEHLKLLQEKQLKNGRSNWWYNWQ